MYLFVQCHDQWVVTNETKNTYQYKFIQTNIKLIDGTKNVIIRILEKMILKFLALLMLNEMIGIFMIIKQTNLSM